jgi:hypothetical protein
VERNWRGERQTQSKVKKIIITNQDIDKKIMLKSIYNFFMIKNILIFLNTIKIHYYNNYSKHDINILTVLSPKFLTRHSKTICGWSEVGEAAAATVTLVRVLLMNTGGLRRSTAS